MPEPLYTPQAAADTVGFYSFEEAGDSIVRPAPKPKTVAGVLRLLPADATPEQQDSAVQAMIEIPPPTHLSTRPDTLYLPGLKGSPANIDLTQFDLRKNYFSEKPYFHPEQRVTQKGMAAEPVVYRLSDDSYVTGLLMLSFFIGALSIARNIRSMAESVKNFFYSRPDGETEPRTGSELRGEMFLVLQTCLTMAVLFFDYTQLYLTEVFNQVSPYILLGIDTGVCLLYFMLKILAYKFVNWVFFQRKQNRLWIDSYLTIVVFLGIALFAVALLVVYFNMPFKTLATVVVLLLAISKFALAVKCRQTFFNYRYSLVHFFAYFCIMELMPVLLLWKALVLFNEVLIVNI